MSLETCLVISFLAKKIGTPSLGTDSAQIDSAKFTERVKMKVWTGDALDALRACISSFSKVNMRPMRHVISRHYRLVFLL